MIDQSVAIVGGGIAGLTAADVLTQRGLEAHVLEAAANPGGRLSRPLDSAGTEPGAEFVHGSRATTWQMLERFGLSATRYPRSGREVRLYSVNGSLHGDNSDLAIEVERLSSVVEHYSGQSRSVAGLLAEVGGDSVAAWFVRDRFERIEGADLTELDAKQLGRERMLNTAGWENFRVDIGYSALVDSLSSCVTVHTSWPAARILRRRHEVQVVASDGRTHTADHAIVAVPHTTMLAGLHFEPDLPKARWSALRRIRMGHAAKLVLRFAVDDFPPFTYLHSQEEIPTWWRSGTDDPGATALVGFAGGPTAQRLVALGPEAGTELGLACLTRVFGGHTTSSFLDGWLHEWETDQYVGGCYSYTGLDARDSRRAIARPLGRVHFAGEATSFNGHVGTVHGAIESGIRAAAEILASLRA